MPLARTGVWFFTSGMPTESVSSENDIREALDGALFNYPLKRVINDTSTRPQIVYIGKYGKIRCFGIFGLWRPFSIFYGILEAWEVSKNLPGALGFIFPKFRPIPGHGDPIHAPNDLSRDSRDFRYFRRKVS